MKQYRVTKYNPEYRDSRGRYTRDEWTSYSDVGKTVSRAEYERVENSYIESALAFLDEQGISHISIEYIENAQKISEPGIPLKTGIVLDFNDLRRVIQSILREKYWAKLVYEDAFIHFGWDFYMYIGVPTAAQKAIVYAGSVGLFVEEIQSPYLE